MGIKVTDFARHTYFHTRSLSSDMFVAQGLAKLLADYSPGCCREQKYDNYFGRKIAIDASMHIYQALVWPQQICPVCTVHIATSCYRLRVITGCGRSHRRSDIDK